ncbi:hypothetical protein PGH07_04600 [Sulfurovum sp. zt1-1]|uniref:Uncharacterized protein n=1 Tax=Sulfurovum zhangzhouensis TaxID=3019067 RepID=A0ABT7QY29_9BACT|nr:hypothetical protein [Sulfurovum zhangzhouensis]MDM5271449.1 hypothetical protein [Sulfurovum zhangzhouensis]
MDFNKRFTQLIKQFLWMVSFLIVLATLTVSHYLCVDRTSQKEAFSQVVAVTGLASPSFSTAFYEPNVLGEKIEHPVFPQMQSLNRMDFVYAE